jgi:hypothetical protein
MLVIVHFLLLLQPWWRSKLDTGSTCLSEDRKRTIRDSFVLDHSSFVLRPTSSGKVIRANPSTFEIQIQLDNFCQPASNASVEECWF